MTSGADAATSSGAGQPPTQAGHLLAIESKLGKDVLLLTRLDGVEAVSGGFVYTIEMLTRATEKEVRGLLGEPVTLWLRNDSEMRRRPLHGHVRHLALQSIDKRGYHLWRAEVAPWLWFLTHSVDCRIYQDRSIPDILRSVFDEHGLIYYELRLHNQYPKLPFCVQYRESTLAFVSRLMEHVGIFYCFEHYPEKHVLVVSDNSTQAKFITPQQVTLALRADIGEIQQFQPSYTFRPGKWALNDFDFESPTKNLQTRERTLVDIDPMQRFEVYDYPGNFLVRDSGSAVARLRIEQEEVLHHRISGAGSCAGFDAGKRFMLALKRADPAAEQAAYFLTEVRHSASNGSYFTSLDAPATYSNHFTVIPAKTPFRPERMTPWPVVRGPQTATVVGPAGENIHTDQYGRVRVLFHWDRRGKRDEHASCWIRVSQVSAGSHWGALAIPHVGQEVIVGFLEGDPDRPIVIGHVHNGLNMPPLTLPRDKNKTVMRDHGDNRLIMHGKAGQERLSLVSPKNINFVAMRSPAKPLSAQTIDNISFDDNTDPNSLKELLSIYNELKNPVPSPSGPVAPPNPKDLSPNDVPVSDLDSFQGGAGLGDFTASAIDINTLSEHNISSLSIGNTNEWVNENLNTWVNGDSNTFVNGNATSTVGGTQHGGTSTSSTNTTEVWSTNVTISHQDNYTRADRDNITGTGRDNITSVAETNSTTCKSNYTGANLNTQVTLGINTSATIGLNLQFNPQLSLALNGMSLSVTGLSLQQNITEVKTDADLEITSVGQFLGVAGIFLLL